jgi:hypothetical protein
MGTYQAVAYREPRVGCRPGAVALRDYTDAVGFSNKGCFNPNSFVPGGSLSLHVVGRAVDLSPGDGDFDEFDAYIRALVDADIGIQQVLWNREGWSYQRPYWHALTAPTDMHLDHAHTELTIAAADTLTVARLSAALIPPPPPQPVEEEVMTPQQLADSIGGLVVNGVVSVNLVEDDGVTQRPYPLAAAVTYIHRELKLARLRGQ